LITWAIDPANQPDIVLVPHLMNPLIFAGAEE